MDARKKNNPQSIHHRNAIREILNHIRHDSWVVFDLDNTLIETKSLLGSDQWFVSFIKMVSELALDQKEAFALVLPIYTAIQNYSKTQCVEPIIIPIIKALKKIGIPVIAVTARSESLMEATIRQLEDLNIQFTCRPDLEKRVMLGQDDGSPIYYNGIVFCNGQDKGQSFAAYLEFLKDYPKHIVMVDDKEKYLIQMSHALKKIGVKFDGIRYGYLDQKVESFDLKQTNSHLAYLYKNFSKSVQNNIERLDLPLEIKQDDMESEKNYFYPQLPPKIDDKSLSPYPQKKSPTIHQNTIESFNSEKNTSLFSPQPVKNPPDNPKTATPHLKRW